MAKSEGKRILRIIEFFIEKCQSNVSILQQLSGVCSCVCSHGFFFSGSLYGWSKSSSRIVRGALGLVWKMESLEGVRIIGYGFILRHIIWYLRICFVAFRTRHNIVSFPSSS